MNCKLFLILPLFLLLPAQAHAITYYVSPTGQASCSGTTLSCPLENIQTALDKASAGDTVLLRQGTYLPNNAIRLTNKSGMPQSPITLESYQTESVIISGANINPNDTGWGIIILNNASYIHLKNFSITGAIAKSGNLARHGIQLRGDSSHNLLSHLQIYNNQGSGIHLEDQASSNRLEFIDSFLNYDPPAIAASGSHNADGFAIKGTSTNPALTHNNELYACRAWDNADDGFDLWYGGDTTISYSIAHDNGFNPDNQGDGNGFKFGAGPGNHLIHHSIAYGNGYKGFDRNGNWGQTRLYFNTAYNNNAFNGNGANFFLKPYADTPTNGSILAINNLAPSPNQLDTQTTSISNSWDFAWINQNNSIFASTQINSPLFLSLSSMSPARNSGQSIPELPDSKDPNPDLGALAYPNTLETLLQPTTSVTLTPIPSPQASSSPTPTTTPKTGDTNNDGKVDLTDYARVLQNFNQLVATNPSLLASIDLNGNGTIDLYDYSLVITNFGH